MIPYLSQQKKIRGYIQSCASNEALLHEYEVEFESLVMTITQIQSKSEKAFEGINTL